jgi:diguanylate cyclase (GGDEF)-like protein
MTPDQPRLGFGRTTSGEWKHHEHLPDDPSMTPAELHGTREATAALDEHLARSLRLVVPVLASIYAVSLLTGRGGGAATSSQVLVTAAALVLALACLLRPVPASLANPILAGGLAAIAVEAVVRGADAAPNLSLALVSAGAVALRPRWAMASAAAVLGPWLAAATTGLWGWRLDDHATTQLAAAAAMAAVVFEARHGSIAGLVHARGVMHALALTDPLTGLLNRRGIEEEAGRMLAAGAAELSIVYLDLDGFKAVNDRLGHAEGDRALQTTAAILLDTFRAADAVGRIGGDEFVIVVAPGSDATVAARRLELHLDAWHDAQDRYTLRASIGVGHVASATLDGFWDAVDAADRRMYSEKQARQDRETHPAAAPALMPALT